MSVAPAAHALTQEMLAAVFPSGVPPRLVGLAAQHTIAQHLIAFKANPVLSVPYAPARLAISDAGEPRAEWIARVEKAWPKAGAAALFAAHATAERLMVDSDGDVATFYADDLNATDTYGHVLMCSALSTDGRSSRLTRHQELPSELLSAGLLEEAAQVGGLGGFWAVRWADDSPQSLLWISESRYRGTAEKTGRYMEPAAGTQYGALRSLARGLGFIAYPDGIELFATGRMEITVAFVLDAPSGR